MSPFLVLSLVGLFYIVWAGILLLKWTSTHKLQEEVYPQYIKDGTLKPTVASEAFKDVFMRVEGPRFGIYTFIGACFAPFIIVIGLRIFNLIWDIIWKQSGALPWFEVGEFPHSAMVVFLCAAILFAVAWVTMRVYYIRAPGSFKTEMRRLNGEIE